MAIYCSYLLSLLFLLLITHCVNTASLRSYLYSFSKSSLDNRYHPSIVDNELTTSEPILSRRRPLLSSNERRKRWTKEEDNDEVEIPIDETNIEQMISTTTIDNKSIVLRNNSNDIFSFDSTMNIEQSNINNSQINFDENSTIISTITEIKYPLLRQDLIEINETNELTTISINDDILQNNKTDIEQSIENNDNLTTITNIFPLTTSNEITDISSTESETLSTNVTDINQVISNESAADTIDNLTTIEIISNETETSSIPISINQTVEETSIISQTELSTITEFESDPSTILLNYTTILPEETNDNQTLIDSGTTIVSEYNTTVIDESIDTTIITNATQNDTTFVEEGITSITTILDVLKNVTTITDQGIDDDTTMTSEVTQTDISTMITDDDDEYSNETTSSLPETAVKPICDLSCQCSQECPYGFEIIGNKCKCDPPCKNYQCFGDDICTVTKKGQALCQPKNGTEYGRPIRCYQPRDAGYHDISIRYHNRWYYDPNQDTCHLFVYRGLGGNENNFETLHECHLECITCAPAPDRGSCLAHLPMWYYDYKQKKCSRFDYSGCKGNENKFLRKQECIDTCITRILNI
ncbi:unnamed protein product [Rotaria sordida]|uniref:BPTI/Kunitz inhibitor domain-containing protein n=1 Tax=Rotaria sordida TaxID=392033 RepID=A0A815AWM3_9BILA|nr:unnamed protein product [Rotaria sordida]